MATHGFEFEKPLVVIDEKIEKLREDIEKKQAEGKEVDESVLELDALATEREILAEEIYTNLSPWERVLIARHKDRPRSQDIINNILTEWHEVKGDRYFHDDNAVLCGLARLNGEPVAVIGQQKGKDTKENVARNFGMMHPEGYRKALRVMHLAERFHLPVLIFIDTPGAYPGIGAEERGQSEAIARNIMEMFQIRTPLIGVIIGEGASGGALGVGVVDYMMMLENSWYCVISPEGCASILWRDAAKAPEVAEILQLTPSHLMKFKIANEIIPEPRGGAHCDPATAIEAMREPLLAQVRRLNAMPVDEMLEARFQKYRTIGVIAE